MVQRTIVQLSCDVCATNDTDTPGADIRPIEVRFEGRTFGADVCRLCGVSATLGEVMDLGQRVKRAYRAKVVKATRGARSFEGDSATNGQVAAPVVPVVTFQHGLLPDGVERTPDGLYLHRPTGRETKNFAGMQSYLRGKRFK